MLRPIISHDYHLFLVKAGNRLFEQGSIRKIYSHTSYPFQSNIILQHNSFCLSAKLKSKLLRLQLCKLEHNLKLTSLDVGHRNIMKL